MSLHSPSIAAAASQVVEVARAIQPSGPIQAEAFWSAVIAVVLMGLSWGATVIASRHQSVETRRFWKLTFRHIAVVAFVLSMVLIWRHQIQNGFLALGTMFAALLVTMRENWMSLAGFWVRVGRRHYSLDDYIEIDGVRGRVLSISWLATVVAETGPGSHGLTGRVVHIPNYRTLLAPMAVENATGQFSAHLLSLTLPGEVDVLRAEQLLLDAACKHCAPHLVDAARHMARLQRAEAMDTPSIEPKLLMHIDDYGHVKLTLRFVARACEKQKIEQAILRDFLARAGEASWPGQQAKTSEEVE